MIVGTAGHIDHGKTSLVRALTGIDTDRLPEEKARGITLDLGFAYVPLPNGEVLGFVDVPGHERLVHTMIAGASSIGMALLVVAADDGIMPQTREHLLVLSFLGVSRIVVALTKIDLVTGDRALEVELDIAALLPEADVFPVSVVTGAGVTALRSHLLAARDEAAIAEGRAFRLAVDRSFSLSGAGTVVTGSVFSGSIGVGDSVLVLPNGLRARVRGIHAANQPTQRAVAGERCALNLIGAGVRKDAIRRGDWVMEPSGAAMSRRCDVLLRPAVKTGTKVLVHHGAGQIAGRVVMLDDGGLAQLILHHDVPLRFGDRLVLRDAGANHTVAGGQVLEPSASERHRRRPDRLAALRAMAAGDGMRGLLGAPPYLVRRDTLLGDWGLTEAGFAAALPDGVAVGAFVACSAGLASLTEAVTAALASFHARLPAAPGMTPEALRLALPWRLSRDAFATLLANLLGTGVVAAEAHLVRAPSHRGGLAGEDARIWDALRPLLESLWFRPPLLREAAASLGVAEVLLRRACKGFARLGLVVEVAPDRFFIRDAVAGLAAAAHALSAAVADGWFTAAQFRDQVGCGRQLAIQVLEDFDRRGVTVRRGDLRKKGKESWNSR